MKEIDKRCINAIRTLSIDAIENAKSGHPGAPLGMAPMAYVLWRYHMKHNPLNPLWPDRDRFILSAGHASAMLYSLLYLSGYKMTLEDLKNFRQWKSKTPGHPEYDPEYGIETTTGPLGQGFGNAVGMAIAEAFLSAVFNRPGFNIVDHYTFVIASDGDLMEGISHEAASLAGHLKLSKLIVLYDKNRISIEGNTDITFTEDVKKRFEAYGWQVLEVHDGNDIDAIGSAIEIAKNEKTRPSLIIVHTHIGYGSPLQDNPKVHGAPLGPENVRKTKENLGWPVEPPFFVPDDVLDYMRSLQEKGEKEERAWQNMFNEWRKEYPELAEKWYRFWNLSLPENLDELLPEFRPEDGPLATRKAFNRVLNSVAKHIENLIGGSADLAPSNLSYMEGLGDFEPSSYSGRNLHFGVREHIMGAALNGIMLHGGLRGYAATFLVFSDYMRPSIRLAAMMKLPVIYIFTHDSIGIGQDGPTHQPIEQLPSLRAIPGLTVIRPADANETARAFKIVLETKEGPVALLFTRQNVPILDPEKYPIKGGVEKGAYILEDSEGLPELIIAASGSEIHVALEASRKLRNQGVRVRVVSMPSWEIFEKQPDDYKSKVFPKEVKNRIFIEAAYPLGWCRWAEDIRNIRVIGTREFGVSAPGKVVLEKFGFNAENVVSLAKELLKRG